MSDLVIRRTVLEISAMRLHIGNVAQKKWAKRLFAAVFKSSSVTMASIPCCHVLLQDDLCVK